MTERLRDAAFELSVRLREGQKDVSCELAELELALAAAAIEREHLEDLPRLIELEKHGDHPATESWSDWTVGWNAALDQAAALVRYQLQLMDRDL